MRNLRIRLQVAGNMLAIFQHKSCIACISRTGWQHRRCLPNGAVLMQAVEFAPAACSGGHLPCTAAAGQACKGVHRTCQGTCSRTNANTRLGSTHVKKVQRP